MSKVKIQGNASGSGVLTISAPNTSTDRTITLPDSTDTLAVNSDVTNKLPLAGGTLTGNTTIATNSVPLLALKRTGNNAGNGYIECHGADDSVDYAIRFAQTNGVMSFDNGGSRIMGVTADGLTFGSDTAAVNALSDYEEGVHQTTFAAGNGQSITTGRNDLGYTKIGNLVNITGEITCGAASSPTGGTTITLPFVIATNAGDREFNFGAAPLCYHVNEYEDRMPMILGGSGASTVTLLYQRHDASFYDFNVAASDTFFFSFSYKTN